MSMKEGSLWPSAAVDDDHCLMLDWRAKAGEVLRSRHFLVLSCSSWYEQRQMRCLGCAESSAEWEIEADELTLGPRIGIGSFGEVFRGTWRHTDVAVKRFLEQDLSPQVIAVCARRSQICHVIL